MQSDPFLPLLSSFLSSSLIPHLEAIRFHHDTTLGILLNGHHSCSLLHPNQCHGGASCRLALMFLCLLVCQVSSHFVLAVVFADCCSLFLFSLSVPVHDTAARHQDEINTSCVVLARYLFNAPMAHSGPCLPLVSTGRCWLENGGSALNCSSPCWSPAIQSACFHAKPTIPALGVPAH